jgi:hypothetical protein
MALDLDPIFAIEFQPKSGADRGFIKVTWPEGRAVFCDITGRELLAFADQENRGWTLARFARFEFSIASRQHTSIGFACDSQEQIDEIAEIAKEFPLRCSKQPFKVDAAEMERLLRDR